MPSRCELDWVSEAVLFGVVDYDDAESTFRIVEKLKNE